MAMADTYHCMPTIEVEILLAFVVPYIAALTIYYVYVEKGIYVK